MDPRHPKAWVGGGGPEGGTWTRRRSGGRPDVECAGAGDSLADGQNSGDVGPRDGDNLADGQTSGDEGLGAGDGLTGSQTTGDVGAGSGLTDGQTSSDEGAGPLWNRDWRSWRGCDVGGFGV